MSVAKAVLLLTSVISLFVFVRIYLKGGNCPRGPIGLPVVGYYLYLGKDTYRQLQSLASVYGPIFSVQIGSKNVIVLDDFQSNKDAFSQDAFMGRPPKSAFEFNPDTIASGAYDGVLWAEQRRFSMQMIKELLSNQSHLEDMMKEEVSDFVKHLESFNTTPSSIRPLLSPSVTTTLGALMFGHRLPFGHPDRTALADAMAQTSDGARQMAWQMFFPWLAKMLKSMKKGPDERVASVWKEFKGYVSKQIEKHEKTLDPNNPRDYVDGYLLEARERDNSAFTKRILEDLVAIFYSLGSDTVRSTVEWLMLAVAAHPDVQGKVQQEIDHVVGQSRQPSWHDHPHMPYTRATIYEVMRWRTISPLSLVRYTLWDTELHGYFIPKHSLVISNLWSVHHNQDYWGPDADDFRPERFLEEDERELKTYKHFVPFSIGKRSCPGESFARSEIFLYFSTTLQKFNVSLPSGVTPNFEGDLGVALSPKPQTLRFKIR